MKKVNSVHLFKVFSNAALACWCKSFQCIETHSWVFALTSKRLMGLGLRIILEVHGSFAWFLSNIFNTKNPITISDNSEAAG